MRNSSDIFCLKEPKTGENDGSKIFSVNGSCFSKITRRYRASNNLFQPDGSQPNEDQNLTTEANPSSAEVDEKDKLPDFDVDQLSEVTESAENLLEQKESGPKGAGEPATSSSSMRRNPLTGAGVEDVEKRSSRKRCEPKSGKWLW